MVCFMIILIFDKLESNFCRSIAAHSWPCYVCNSEVTVLFKGCLWHHLVVSEK